VLTVQNSLTGQPVDGFYHNLSQSQGDAFELTMASFKIWGRQCQAANVSVGSFFQIAPSGIGSLTITHTVAYQLHLLNTIHPDFAGIGLCDNRLNKNSDLNCGCGGVGFIWRCSIMASPVNNITSNHFCPIKLPLPQCQTTELGVGTIIFSTYPAQITPLKSSHNTSLS